VVSVSHGPVKLVYTDLGPKGASVGDSYSADVPAKGPGGKPARVVGTLTTVGENVPAQGKEIRTTKLVFIFANPNDQIEIGGASVYSATTQTRPKKSVTIRPIVGGQASTRARAGGPSRSITRTATGPTACTSSVDQAEAARSSSPASTRPSISPASFAKALASS